MRRLPFEREDRAAPTPVEVVARFFDEVLAGDRDLDVAAQLLAEDFVDHDPAGNDTGPRGVLEKLAGLWRALPDAAFERDIVVADGELVSVHSRLVTGAGEAAFADVYRVADGRIREHWHVVDTGALAALMG